MLQLALDGLGQQLDTMLLLVRHVMRQTRERIFHGETRTQGKILSLFEPATEVIRKGKLGKPNQFGNMVKLQEAENQIVIRSVGSAMGKNGGPDARGASAWSSGDTVSIAAATKASTE
jgi:hypothetical protein